MGVCQHSYVIVLGMVWHLPSGSQGIDMLTVSASFNGLRSECHCSLKRSWWVSAIYHLKVAVNIDRDWFAANVNYVASRRHCVLSGDFNARHEEFGEIEGAAANNDRGAWLRDLMLPLQMECLNYTWLDGDYTHIASNAQHSNSMIDLVFTNAPGIIYDIEVMRDTVLVSDHLPLRIVVKAPDAQLSVEKCTREVYDLHSATDEQWEQYDNYLNASLGNYEQLLRGWDTRHEYVVNRQHFIDDAYDQLLSCITTAAKLCIGTKHISYTAQNWWSDKSATSIPQLYREMRSAAIALNDDRHDPELTQQLRVAKATFRHAVAAAKYESWKSFCSKVQDEQHSKLLWNVWHQSLGSAKSPLNSIPNADDQTTCIPN
jgi:hypothetical protein